MYWNLIINFDWNIIEIEITKYKHSTELSCNVPTLPVGLSDTQIGVCSVYVFMYGLRRLSRVEVIKKQLFFIHVIIWKETMIIYDEIHAFLAK